MEKKNKSPHKPVLLATTLLLTAISLSACVVPADGGGRGGWDRHHHWDNDRNWNDDNSDWQHRHGNWIGQH